MNEMCRICIKKDPDEMVSVFCALNNEVIANMIIDCSDILITENDNLPSQVCKNCLFELESAYTLRKKCRDSDVKLRKMIFSPGNSKIVQNIEKLKQETTISKQQEIVVNFVDEIEEELEETIIEIGDKPVLNADDKSYPMKLHNISKSLYTITAISELYQTIVVNAHRCCGCTMIFDTEEQLREHGIDEHSKQAIADESKKYECKNCFKKFTRQSNLKLHVNSAAITELYHCRICDNVYEYTFRLLQHQKGHNISKYREFAEKKDILQVELPENSFRNKRKRKSETTSHRIRLPPFSQCEYIQKYDTYDHLKIKGVRCCGCALVFDTRAQLLKHSRAQHWGQRIVSNPDPECKVCYTRFPTIKKYNIHVKHYKMDEIYHCKVCNIVFDVKSRLLQHQTMNKTHLENEADGVINFEYVEDVELFKDDDDDEAEEEEMEELEQTEAIDISLSLEEEVVEEEEETRELVVQVPENLGKGVETILGSDKQYYVLKKISKRAKQRRLAIPPAERCESVESYPMYEVYQVFGERCCGCTDIFDDLIQLQDHAKSNHSPLNPETDSWGFRCDICYVKFKQQSAFTTHQHNRMQNFMYYCKLCDIVFDVKTRFDQHRKISTAHKGSHVEVKQEDLMETETVDDLGHSKQQTIADSDDRIEVFTVVGYRCCGCPDVFDTPERLGLHSDEVHLNDKTENAAKPFECDICYRRFSKTGALTYHKNTASIKTLYRCKVCGCQHEFLSRLKQHLLGGTHARSALKQEKIKEKMQMGEKKFVDKPITTFHCCFIRCAQQYQTNEELLEHAMLEHQIKRSQNTVDRESDDFVCEICCRSQKSQKSLYYHRSGNRIANAQHAYICSTCGQSRKTAKELATHEISHSAVKPFQCLICQKRFVSKEILKTHGIVHSNIKPFKCEFCDKEFYRKRNMKDHMRSHTNEKPYQCDLCPSTFRLPHSLTLHRRSHTGEKPYKCQYCDNSYSHQTDRKRHEMATHTGIKPHKCQFCTSAFIRKRQLIIHERTHTGERPYSCELCSKSFSQTGYLRKHMLTTHDTTLPPAAAGIRTDEIEDSNSMIEIVQQEDLEYDLVEVLEGDSNVNYDEPFVKYEIIGVNE